MRDSEDRKNSFLFSSHGLSELLSALILLSVSVAVAFILVYALPVISPPEVKPWLKPVAVTDALKVSGSEVNVYLYNPHSEPVTLVDAWSGGDRCVIETDNPTIPARSCFIENGECSAIRIRCNSLSDSILLRFDSGAWLRVRVAE